MKTSEERGRLDERRRTKDEGAGQKEGGEVARLSVALIVKNVVFTLVAPGTVAGVAPWLLLRSGWPQLRVELGAGRWAGVALMAAGALVYAWCVWDFMRARGTPAPIDAPKELVVRGLYQYVRNPMYLGVLLLIVGQAIWFEAGILIVYALAAFGVVHTFVVLYEEPTLSRLFGEAYARYRREVGRWVPRAGGSRQ
jgi:protein-S-isoprenylcysteine O-methyltransferase Ste14